MTVDGLDPVFADAVRARLTDLVTTRRVPWYRRRRWLGVGALAAALLLGGTGVALAGGSVLPGGTETTTLGEGVTVERTGTAAIPLGAAPETTNGISVTLTCLSAGTFTFDDGSSTSCTAADAGGAASATTAILPFEAGSPPTIRADAGARWRAEAYYVHTDRTRLGVNAHGQTFGVQGGDDHPDLVPVTATNGREGYAYQSDLDWAAFGDHAPPTSPAEAVRLTQENAGKVFHTPVYLSDGTTRIGTFDTGP